MTLVDPHFFLFSQLIWQELFKASSNLGLDPFPDSVSHFEGPWQSFWILQTVPVQRYKRGVSTSARLVFKKELV